MPSHLERFLEEKAEPGRFDSHGHFSVSTELALDKLKNHTLADPALWILKLVQAGVAGRAQEIQIKAFRGSTRADLVLSTLPPLEKLEGALLRLESTRGSLLAELCVGLRALLNEHKFRLIWCDGELAQGFTWEGQSLQRLEPHPYSVCSPRLRLELVGPQVCASSRAEEAGLLEKRCRWCGVPLVLDGRQINGPDNLPRSQYSKIRHGLDSPRYLASGWLGDVPPEISTAPPRSPVVSEKGDVLRAETPFLHWPRKPSCQYGGGFCPYVSYEYLTGGIQDLLDLPGHHAPLLISEFFCLGVNRLGVLCGGFESEDFGLGGEVVICGDSLPTDLVGLTVKPDEEWGTAMNQVLEELKSNVEIVKERLLVHGRRPRAKIWTQVRDADFGLMARRALSILGVGHFDDQSAKTSALANDVRTKDNPQVLEKLPDWLGENFRRLAASPPPEYWRRLDLPRGGV